MKRCVAILLVSLGSTLAGSALAQDLPANAPSYKALKCPLPVEKNTWAILERDGANRVVPPYLSSLGAGEGGIGIISSPPFKVSVAEIKFTIRGHDGQGGGREKNLILLRDKKTGAVHRTTFAPGNDALQPRSWDVTALRGRPVVIEVHDAIAEGAFAWLGVGAIDAGPSLSVDFTGGLPEGWTLTQKSREAKRYELTGGIPFLTSYDSIMPARGATDIPCGFQASRLFVLGCTVSRARPLEVHGELEIAYADGTADRIPLMVGYTLEGEYKSLSQSEALHLRPSSDRFQFYFTVAPQPKTIAKITLHRKSAPDVLIRIAAITCETTATTNSLVDLPAVELTAEELRWIYTHTITSAKPGLEAIRRQIREASSARPLTASRALAFARTKISAETYEAASAFDVDKDGDVDIVSGAYWYEGPGFERRHKITDVKRAGGYWADFSDYPMDVNGDGHTDIVVGDFFGQPLRWLENPKTTGAPWRTHAIAQVGAIETTRFWDVDGDGYPEIVPNAGGNVVFFRLQRNGDGRGTGQFTRHVAKIGGCGHGLGYGDINGDGRGDFVVPNGWIEAPPHPLEDEWTWHDDGFRLGSASVPILVHDVDEDGDADIIVGNAHGYGLAWQEQVTDHSGRRYWIHHAIDLDSSQYHDMMLADLDRDGQLELVTGKRYHAHNGNDPGSADPLFVRYYDIDKGEFTAHVIDDGPAETSSGVGIYFWIEDVDGNGWPDIVAPGKEGLHLFKNQGFPRD